MNKNITDISNMFSGCKSLISLKEISYFDCLNKKINGKYSKNKKIDDSEMNKDNSSNFAISYNSNEPLASEISLDNFKFIKEDEQIRNYIVESSRKLINLDSMAGMFYECSSLISLPDISAWDTSKVFNIGGMFFECNISKWKFSYLENMGAIFYGCSSLMSLQIYLNGIFLMLQI